MRSGVSSTRGNRRRKASAATDFGHRFGEGVMEWRDQQIIPRYNASGTKRFAFHVPEGFPTAMEAGGQPVIDSPATFPTAWFTHRQHALDWLSDT
jgi:hypothetical protein